MRSSASRIIPRLWKARGRLHVALLQRTGLLPYVNLTQSVVVNGRSFRAPVTQGICVGDADPEPWLDVVLGRLLASRNGAFVDVGANLGQTLLKVKAVDPGIDYWGFEPNPRCYCYLKELIELNQLPACRTYPFALGDAAKVLELFHTSRVDAAASLVEGFRPASEYATKQFASIFAGDAVLAQGGPSRVSTIKIDVEGAELEVILGLAETLERDHPSIVCEVLPVYDAGTPNGIFRLERQRRLESRLRDLGYSIHRIQPDGSTVELQEIGVHANLALCNYVFLSS